MLGHTSAAPGIRKKLRRSPPSRAGPPRWVLLLSGAVIVTIIPQLLYLGVHAEPAFVGVHNAAASEERLSTTSAIGEVQRKMNAIPAAPRGVVRVRPLDAVARPPKKMDPLCAAFRCTCQGFSDAYGSTHSESNFERAAGKTDLVGWWIAKKCKTDPTGYVMPIPPPPRSPATPVFPSSAALAAWRDGEGRPAPLHSWECATRQFVQHPPLHDGAIDRLSNVCIQPRVDREKQTLMYYEPSSALGKQRSACTSAARCEHASTDSDFRACKVLWVDGARFFDEAEMKRCIGPSPPLCERGRPVLFLTAPPFNIGHQLFDAMWTIFPLLESAALPLYRAVFIPWDLGCTQWLCTMLQALHRIKFNAPLPVVGAAAHRPGVAHGVAALRGQRRRARDGALATELEPSVVCFEDLLVPHFSHYRPGYGRQSRLSMDSAVLLRRELTKSFPRRTLKQVRLGKRKGRVALYAHTSSKYRHWLDMEGVKEALLARGGLDVELYPSFGRMTYAEQCRAFYDADVLLMTHGGQMANTVCVRPGARIVEVDCNWINMNSHLGRAKRCVARGVLRFAFPKRVGVYPRP